MTTGPLPGALFSSGVNVRPKAVFPPRTEKKLSETKVPSIRRGSAVPPCSASTRLSSVKAIKPEKVCAWSR